MSETKQLIDILDQSIHFALANVHTSTIARVEKVDSVTIDVKPVVNRVNDGVSIELTTFTKVPPLFLQGGGSYTAHPISVGDYCLLILTERCYDRWYDGQDFKAPAEYRMHDYSDGIAIVGVNPLSSAITIPSVIQQTGDTNQDGNYTHQGDRTQTGDYNHTGDVDRTGNRTQVGDDDVTGNGTFSGNVAASSFSGISGGPVTSTVDMQTTQNIDAATYSVGGVAGDTGTFTTADAKTVTVVNGLITSIT